MMVLREVTQVSLGFSPAELVCGHLMRDPSKVLKEKWLAPKDPPTNLLDFVCNFQSKLSKACELAQERMKGWNDY